MSREAPRSWPGAIAALGLWNGDPAACDHAAEAGRLGGALAYRAHLANWLLGAVQATLIEIEGGCLERDHWVAAVGQELHSAVREEDDRALLGLLRWQALRVAYRLRELAGRDRSGPIVLAAAHTAGALQGLLGLLEQGPLLRDALAGEAELDDEQVLALPGKLGTAREALASADANLAILAGMLVGVEDVGAFGAEDLDGVERELLEAAVQLAPMGGCPTAARRRSRCAERSRPSRSACASRRAP
jgi:hypothetical protein